jgi:hypothetical protein
MGTGHAVLAPVACMLGITVSGLTDRTIAAAFPWATGFVARESPVSPVGPGSSLRPAVCPRCLDEQRAQLGFSWICQAWALAWRTMCSRHGIRLLERDAALVPPAWQNFFGLHHRVQQMTCALAFDRLAPAVSDDHRGTTLVTPMECELLRVQDSLASVASRGGARNPDPETRQATMVSDIVWALMQSDRVFPERMTYEAFALEGLDSEWHIARRRSAVPADYTLFGIHVRHAVMAAALVLVSGRQFRSKLSLPRSQSDNDLAFLLTILVDADAAALVARSVQWPESARAALLSSGKAGLHPAPSMQPSLRFESTHHGKS